MNDDPPVERPFAPADENLSSELLRALLEDLPVIMYFKDRDSRFLAVSRPKAQRHGLEPPELVGKSDADFFAPEHAQWARVDEENVMATNEPVVRKLERPTWLTGENAWVQTTKLPLRDEAGEIIGTFGITEDVTEAQQVAHGLENTRRSLLDASRLAGMAEVATGVLHNVGNVLTSLNVSANVVAAGLHQSKADTLARIVALLHEHAADLPAFLTADPKGRRIPELLQTLAQHMADERDRLVGEMVSLQANIDHIKEIVTMQQAYATTAGTIETMDPTAVVEDSLRMNAGALIRHEVSVVREFHPVPPIRGEKAKVLQILVNLIRNAKYACDDGGSADKIITIRIESDTPGRVQISVRDNGVGIPRQNLEKLFQHGFTTRSGGHGFGLHSARQAAADLHGILTAQSDGVGHGATFTLDLPADDTASGGRPTGDQSLQ